MKTSLIWLETFSFSIANHAELVECSPQKVRVERTSVCTAEQSAESKQTWGEGNCTPPVISLPPPIMELL